MTCYEVSREETMDKFDYISEPVYFILQKR